MNSKTDTGRTIRIDEFAYGGAGIGKLEGKAVFVPYGVPGDLLSIRIIKEKKSWAEAEITSILEYSPYRQEPVCPCFGKCGGCQWMHVTSEKQHDSKENFFRAFIRKDMVASRDYKLQRITSPKELNYRHSAQFAFRKKNRNPVIGFHGRKSNVIEDIEYCHLLRPDLNNFLTAFRNFMEQYPGNIEGRLELIAPSRNVFLASMVMDTGILDPARRFLSALAADNIIKGGILMNRQWKKVFATGITHSVSEIWLHGGSYSKKIILHINAGGFMQPNFLANQFLLDTIMAQKIIRKTDHLLDLFCGTGNFSLPLSYVANRVTGIDVSFPGIDAAGTGAHKNSIDNTVFYREDLSRGIPENLAGPSYDVLLMDPPRDGAYRIVQEIEKLKPERIIYVSCSPPTFARDLSVLVKKGYSPRSSVILDLFPQTYHIETITFLDR